MQFLRRLYLGTDRALTAMTRRDQPNILTHIPSMTHAPGDPSAKLVTRSVQFTSSDAVGSRDVHVAVCVCILCAEHPESRLKSSQAPRLALRLHKRGR